MENVGVHDGKIWRKSCMIGDTKYRQASITVAV